MPPPAARHVRSRQNTLVGRFREAARRAHGARSEVLLEGLTLIEEARAAGLHLVVAVVAEDALLDPAAARLFRSLGDDVDRVTVPRAVLEAMSPARSPSGAVALARPPAHALEHVFEPAPALVVVAVDVQDPGNLGAIIRVAEAAGATGALVVGAAADPFSWKALRGSMGSSFRLPVVRLGEVTEALDACRARGLRLVASTLGDDAFDTIDFRGGTALLVGAEGSGLPAAVLAVADAAVAIPMRAPVASLNVAVAAGILLYDARRQRIGPS